MPNEIEEFDDNLHEEFRSLWDQAAAIRDENHKAPGFANFVAADYQQVLDALLEQRDKRQRFLEWGSGLGVATIMASRLGFESYGIEIESVLVDFAMELAETHDADAEFFVGSFIPDGFELDIEEGDEVFRTVEYTEPAYDEMDMELRDFDLVYAYPWPDEHGFHFSIMRQFANPAAILLTYDAREGMQKQIVDENIESQPDA